MIASLALAALLLADAPSRPTQNGHPDGIRLKGTLVGSDTAIDGRSIRIRGTCDFRKSEPPTGFDIFLWYGGRTKEDTIANEAAGVIVKDDALNTRKQLNWEASIRANYAGEGPYFLEVVPHCHGKYYYDVNNDKISWVKPIKIQKKP